MAEQAPHTGSGAAPPSRPRSVGRLVFFGLILVVLAGAFGFEQYQKRSFAKSLEAVKKKMAATINAGAEPLNIDEVGSLISGVTSVDKEDQKTESGTRAKRTYLWQGIGIGGPRDLTIGYVPETGQVAYWETSAPMEMDPNAPTMDYSLQKAADPEDSKNVKRMVQQGAPGYEDGERTTPDSSTQEPDSDEAAPDAESDSENQ